MSRVLWEQKISRVRMVLCLIARGENFPKKERSGLDREIGGSQIGGFLLHSLASSWVCGRVGPNFRFGSGGRIGAMSLALQVGS